MDFCENFRDLLQRKTVQELAHPYGIRPFGELGCIVENVAWNGIDAVVEPCCCGILFGDGGLPWQVDDGNLNVCIVFAAGDSPFGCVSANIEEPWRLYVGELFKYDWECFGEC